MSKNKNKLMIASCALALLAGTFGFTQAYFTDKETISNTFEIGSVKIELQEPTWEDVENAIPCKQYSKDPQVFNNGENEAFVYLEVKVPTAEVITTDEEGNRITSAVTELFSFVDLNTTNWEQIGTKSLENGYTIYVYGYKEALNVNTTTEPLFTAIEFANLIEGQTFEDNIYEDSNLSVDVKAMAIQAEETGTMLEAYEKYINQNM